MKKILTAIFLVCALQIVAQPKLYTAANAHSHNDYEQANPFYEAWQNGFGSIEADIYLHDGKLLVAHEIKELNDNRSLQILYLNPLLAAVKKNNGFPYADTSKELQLMIDIKNDSVNTLNKLVEVLQQYPAIIHCHKIKVSISGNRPAQEQYISYPSFIYFDGVLGKEYSAKALSKIVMLSDNFKTYSSWNGIDSMNEADETKLIALIAKAHSLKKKVRFWNAPDNTTAWKKLMQLHVDYINTDHIKELAKFFDAQSRKQ